MASEQDAGNVIISVGEAQMVKTKSGIQYRIGGLWTNPEAYANYIWTVLARAANGEGPKLIGKAIGFTELEDTNAQD